MSTYLFTDIHCKEVLDTLTFDSSEPYVINLDEETNGLSPGDVALIYRAKLEDKTNKKVVAWCLMGGDNQKPII